MKHQLKYFLATIFFAMILASCKKPKVDIPHDVIKPDTMVMVLVDVHIAEAAVLQKNIAGENGDSMAPSFYKFVFQKHHIDATTYNRSVSFYNANPDIYEKIYEQVLTELSKQQAQAAK